MCRCQKILIKNQDIYLLKSHISVSSKPSKTIIPYLYCIYIIYVYITSIFSRHLRYIKSLNLLSECGSSFLKFIYIYIYMYIYIYIYMYICIYNIIIYINIYKNTLHAIHTLSNLFKINWYLLICASS